MRFRGVLPGLLGAALGAQSVATPLVVPVPGADTLVVAVVLEHGLADDPPAAFGVARFCAEIRLQRARAVLPAGAAAGARVGEDRTVVFGAVRGAEAAAGLAFLRAVLADLAATDDEIALARARVALAADDEAWRLPGGVLQSRARAALFADGRARPPAGDATALLQIPKAELLEHVRRPVGTSCAAFGATAGVEGEWLALGSKPCVRVVPVLEPVRPQRAELEILEHPLVDAPFVALAFPAPSPAAAAACAVGLEFAKARAAARLPSRPEQLRAHAPTVAWSWLDGDPVVMFVRRARRAGPPTAALAELEAFVADLRSWRPREEEVARAAAVLLGESAPLPWPEDLMQSLSRSGQALPGRAVQALLAGSRGVDRSGIAGIDGESVAAALRATLDPTRCWRGALVPTGADSATGAIR